MEKAGVVPANTRSAGWMLTRSDEIHGACRTRRMRCIEAQDMQLRATSALPRVEREPRTG